MKYIKIVTFSLSLVVLSVLAFVGVANAQSVKMGDEVTVSANQTVDSMLFTGGNNIVIAGNVNGDVYCAGQNITISGKINGDVSCVGQNITISGTVDGSVRLAGQSVTLTGMISNNATIATQNLNISSDSVIGRDLLGGSQNITINGQVGRDIVAGSQNLTINGKVGRNIDGNINVLTVGSTGKVSGNVDYTSSSNPTIINGGAINGTIKRTLPKEKADTNYLSPMAFTVAGFAYIFIATIVVALTLASLFPRIFKDAAIKTAKAPAKTMFIGFAAMIFTPILIVILLMTIIGIPLAMLTLLAWLLVLAVSGPFASYLLGRSILHTDKHAVWAMLLGTSILSITYFIPIVGFITMFVASLFGIGMIIMQGKKLFARS